MQTEPYPSPTARLFRRVVGAGAIAMLAFLVLWITIFNAVSAALIGAGVGGGALLAASSSDVFQGLLEAVVDAIVGVVWAVAGLFGFDG